MVCQARERRHGWLQNGTLGAYADGNDGLEGGVPGGQQDGLRKALDAAA